MMENNTICSIKILQNPERQLISGEFDIPVNIEYDKSQVTEHEAIRNAIEHVNNTLPDGLRARIADAEQYWSSKNDNVLMQIGLDLFTKH